MEMRDTTGTKPAILVRKLTKQYGNDSKVLDDLNMTVLKGTIYGLLGASGCGKTTLLSSILGSRKIQNGAISILGRPPGIIPVKSIGYMPQDNALVEEFTIKNVLQHQGWIFGMTNEQIEERHKFFEELLDLPPSNKLISQLSGGQQRRVSLAVVLLQDPELLILDEPTVGLDPVLRQNLWDYFIKITKEDKKTVVITTHYIEEAKQADVVGMLRHGKMLVEGEPCILMNQFNSNSLEELFTSLSHLQERDLNLSNEQQQDRLISKFDEMKVLNQKKPKKSLLKKIFFMNTGHTKALLSKNFIRYIRHPGTLSIAITFPIIQMLSIFFCIGRIPDDMTIGIVNQELGTYKNCEDYIKDSNIVLNGTESCAYLSCKFSRQMQNTTPNQIYFESLDEALEHVKQGKIHQVLYFHHNYSEAFLKDLDSNFGKIVLYRDEVDYGLGLFVEKELHSSYLKFAEELAADCHWSKRSAKIPIVFNEPIYGRSDLTLSEYIAPGVLVITTLVAAVGLAVITIVSEKRGGVLERTIISGVLPAEIFVCYAIALSFVSSIQTAESFVVWYYFFGSECKGSLLQVFSLLHFQGLLGIFMGILLSVISKNETAAIYGALAISFPFIFLSGSIWPIEGFPIYLQYVSYILPPTIPTQSLNNIIFRGWHISDFHVYKGYLVSVGYFVLITVISIIGFKFEKK